MAVIVLTCRHWRTGYVLCVHHMITFGIFIAQSMGVRGWLAKKWGCQQIFCRKLQLHKGVGIPDDNCNLRIMDKTVALQEAAQYFNKQSVQYPSTPIALCLIQTSCAILSLVRMTSFILWTYSSTFYAVHANPSKPQITNIAFDQLLNLELRVLEYWDIYQWVVEY